MWDSPKERAEREKKENTNTNKQALKENGRKLLK